MSSVNIRGNRLRAFGHGVKIFSGTVSITGTGSVTVNNANTVLDVAATAVSSSSAIPTNSAAIYSIATNVVKVVVTQNLAHTASVSGSAVSVSLIGTAI